MNTNFPSGQTTPDFPTLPSTQQRKTPWWLPPLIVIGLIVVAGVLGLLLPSDIPFSPFQFPRLSMPREEPSVLLLELGDLPEWRQATIAELFGKRKEVTFSEVLTALQVAQEDPSVRGLYLRLIGTELGWAKLEELRDALVAFRQSGKFIYAYMDVGAEKDYALALAADSIFMPSEGFLKLSGFAAVGVFLPGFLQKLGVTAYVEQFEEYKSAGEPFARHSFSPAARENIRAILAHRYHRFLKWVEQRRGISASTLQQRVFPQVLHRPDSLKAWGLIDGIAHETEVRNLIAHRLSLRDTLQVSKRLISIARYLGSTAVRKWHQREVKKPAIAIVYGVGGIVPGRGPGDPFSEPTIASDDFIAALREAERNEDVGAIIVRLDSPGGSALASDAIWTELRRIARHKPLYASLSDVAASGGYYLAVGCDTIIAHPSTLTGSIGVIFIMFNFAGTAQKLGVGIDTVGSNPEAFSLATPFIPYSERERQRFRTLGAAIYQHFLQVVSQQRRMSLEQIRERARGRVWTGEEAFRVKLVDTLGGLSTAIALAKRRLGIAPEKPVRILEFPRRKEPLELLLELFQVEPTDDTRKAFLSATFGSVPRHFRRYALSTLQLWELSQREPIVKVLPWWALPLL